MMGKRRGMVRNIFISCTEIHMLLTIFILYALLLCFHFPLCFARDTLTLNDPISDYRRETLISDGKKFQLGFFRVVSSPRRYLGIWYYRSNPKTIVWVANRESALFDGSGVFAIAEDGNLMVFDGNNKSHWSTKLKGSVSFNGTVKLFDSGNLVLSKEDGRSGPLNVIWQSFENPTDTFLPGMEMNEHLKLISWKSRRNPAPGNFKFRLHEDTKNQYTISTERSTVYWKSGVSGKFIDSDVPPLISSMLSNVTGSSFNTTLLKSLFPKSPIVNRNITVPSISDKINMRLVMNFDGKVQYYIRTNESTPWVLIWSEPKDNCSVFKACANFASCNVKRGSLCKCLPGFERELQGSSNSEEDSVPCIRKAPLCGQRDKIGNFSSLKVIKVGKPDDEGFEAASEKECKEECLRSCRCQAYAYNETSPSRDRPGNGTCWIWSDILNNIEEGDADRGRVIHLRGNPIVPANLTNKYGGSRGRTTQWTLIVAVTIASVSVLACTIACIYIQKKKTERQEDRASTLAIRYYHSQMHVKDFIDSGEFKEEDKKGIDLPFFDFESILAATDSFSEANKLGKGGFGPVYKGTFPGGQEIAVKRLSSVSGQGLEEFKNEVVLIARLQHRNLVRLLGYCIEGSEKILLYEYMPNKSLDFFIFDRTLRMLLDWEMRFNIILGTARGLLYLHQDSRLRIIHRDLKTSNILLDQEMNPKISDFGLARIFEGKQTEGTTNRVVGTYGYMSPEYALDGFFSVKSDVFSFGVVVLEIISGKRNTGFYSSEKALSLLGHAWKLWQEDKALDIMELQLSASAKKIEILKCINVGLLCVQEDPNDRPTMSNVVVMLSSETATIPTPKQPAFVLSRGLSSSASSSSKPETNTKLTISLDGR